MTGSRMIVTHSAEETARAGEALAALLEPNDVLSLAGDLGAGKTCLTQGVACGLDVQEPVTSPTFNLLLPHPGRTPLYHFDLYRLQRVEELEDIAFWETLEADGVSVIEWGDRFPEALPDDRLSVEITVSDDGSRRLALHPSGPRSTALADAWISAMAEEVGHE
jgi:tRNA threonylcarbamoyladenosine biosynthesis protein TsaE